MRIAVLALGSRGDTQPCVALGLELASRGHDVTVAAAHRYAPLVTAPLIMAPLSVDPAAIVESEEGMAWLGSGPLGFVRGFRTVVEPLAEKLVLEVDAACKGAELVLAPPLGAFGRHLSERYGMRHVLLHFQPSEPTRCFPNPLVPFRTLGATANRASYLLLERLAWAVLGRMADRLRAGVLGLPPLKGDPFTLDRREGVPVLCGVSPLVVPRPPDWPEHVRLTGYWRLPGGGLPGDLEDFLRAGPPPVYVGFGSMAVTPRLGEQVMEALRLAKVRAVVQGLDVPPSDDLVIVGEVPHDQLFRRMAAVVHHGGAGTTGTALTAGVPSVVCPFFADQPFWGRRVRELGAGPEPLPVKGLRAGPLAARLQHAVQKCHEKSAQLGRRLAVENGVKNAADLIEQR
ncbi:glycosyltransferase [Nonomuraea sp. NPDC050663]|uniref:glycosyltransferase n=1 Tax=Nonomuraea sp. NPDC050663 TaxID=3364370 RepID=UPI00379A90C1